MNTTRTVMIAQVNGWRPCYSPDAAARVAGYNARAAASHSRTAAVFAARDSDRSRDMRPEAQAAAEAEAEAQVQLIKWYLRI